MGLYSMITRAIVRISRSTTGAQTVQADDAEGYPTDDDVEFYEQPGVTFRMPVGAEVLLLEVGGDGSNLTALATSGRGKRPTIALQEGEGGLYYAGEFKVFLKADGKVYLGAPSATDYVALASKVEAQLAAIKNAINGAAVSAGDGGATFKTNIMTALNAANVGGSGMTAAAKTLAE